jgi:hypothetical protein
VPKRDPFYPLGVRRFRALANDPKAILEFAAAQSELAFIPLRKRIASLQLRALKDMADQRIAAKGSKRKRTEIKNTAIKKTGNKKTKKMVFPELKLLDLPPLVLGKKSKRRRRRPQSRPRAR